MYDLCGILPDDDVLCDSLAEYAQACREVGGSPGDWRAENAQCGRYHISCHDYCEQQSPSVTALVPTSVKRFFVANLL